MEADFIVAAGDHVHQRRIFGNVVDGLLTARIAGADGAGDQEVEIADSVASAAKRSRGGDLVDALEFFNVQCELFAFDFGCVDEVPAPDAFVVFNGLDQLGFMFLTHAGKFANFASTSKLVDAINVADLEGIPDKLDRLWSQALNSQQLQHRRVILLQQFGLHRELSGMEELLQIVQHALADAWNGEHLLGVGEDVFDLVRVVLNGLRRISVRTDAERILPVNLEQISSLVENVGDGLVIHGQAEGKTKWTRRPARGGNSQTSWAETSLGP